MNRRQFLRLTAAAAGALATPSLFERAVASAGGGTAVSGPNPYGPLQEPDENGIRLPIGSRSRIVARGLEVVAGTGHEWHPLADGGACFGVEDGGWIYVSNSEFLVGGAGALRFDRRGNLESAYPILQEGRLNCAGAPHPGAPGSPARRSATARSGSATRAAFAPPSCARPWAPSPTRQWRWSRWATAST